MSDIEDRHETLRSMGLDPDYQSPHGLKKAGRIIMEACEAWESRVPNGWKGTYHYAERILALQDDYVKGLEFALDALERAK